MLRALDLFCKAGGVTKGLQRAGFHVTGIDIAPQPRYCGDAFICDDVLNVAIGYLMGFDLVCASPPCQAHTNAQRIRGNEHPDLIEATRALLQSAGVPYVIENVPGAPLIEPIELCGSMFGLRTYRHRLFECSFPVVASAHPSHDCLTTKMGRKPRDGEFMHVVGNFSGVAAAREAMGIDWMTRDELREAIPPAYSEYIARQIRPTPRVSPQGAPVTSA